MGKKQFDFIFNIFIYNLVVKFTVSNKYTMKIWSMFLVVLIMFLLLFQLFKKNYNHNNWFYTEIYTINDFKKLTKKMSQKDVVLLWESTHGTQEFYEIRRILSKKLIQNYDFEFIAVEGDWFDIYSINLYIKGLSDKSEAKEVLDSFDRWPQWMRSNKEIEKLVEWLKDKNDKLPDEKKISFYWLDLYWAEKSLSLLQKKFDLYQCLAPFIEDFSLYIQYLSYWNHDCQNEARGVYTKIKSMSLDMSEEEYFFIKQNAFVVKNAEKHYRNMFYQDSSSWNTRVYHMYDTLKKIKWKWIVWAHNTHVWDARATEMVFQNSVNIWQLLREEKKNIFILWFWTYSWKTLAGKSRWWEQKTMIIPPAKPQSYEHIMKSIWLKNSIIYLNNKHLPKELKTPNNNRAIWVTYVSENEYPWNYVKTILNQRYDAFIFIKETSELKI